MGSNKTIMKYLKYSFIALVLFISINSCRKSFLDVEDNTVLLREQYVKDINSLQQYLNGIYILLARDFYNGFSGHQIYTDLTADNIKPNSGNTIILFRHYNWDQIPGTNNSTGLDNGRDDLWKSGYQLIRACSFAIDKANELKGENGEKANHIQGQAYSIRALVHFVLVNVFAQSYNFSPDAAHAGVPYIISWDWNDPFSRNTVAEVYNGLITDLTAAISKFPPGTNNTLVMNQNAAKALLSRIYLFKEDWQKAIALASEVAAAVPLLTSAKYPAKLFTLEESEALFQLAPSSINAITKSYTTNFEGAFFRGSGARFFATKDISNLLTQNPNDSRKIWILSSGPDKDSIAKFPINVVAGFGSDLYRSHYATVLRSSEMFLTVAEAAAKTGDENTARTYLDAIRQRANPTALNSTATGAALLDSIYLERRKELAFEGFRMFDLLRWKQGVNRIDVATGGLTTLPYPSDKAIAPIPQQDVNYGIPQNPNY